MPNEIEISKRQQMLVVAKQNLAVIVNAPRGTATQAAKAVGILVASYPQTPPASPEVYMSQVCNLLSGAPADAIAAMIDPRRGIVSQCNFLPSIAEINKWLKDYEEPQLERIHGLRAEIKTLEGDVPMAELTPEERERRIKASDHIKAALKRVKLGNPAEDNALEQRMNERLKRQQRSVPELAMAALKNLEEMR